MNRIVEWIVKNSLAVLVGVIIGVVLLGSLLIWLVAILKIRHVI